MNLQSVTRFSPMARAVVTRKSTLSKARMRNWHNFAANAARGHAPAPHPGSDRQIPTKTETRWRATQQEMPRLFSPGCLRWRSRFQPANSTIHQSINPMLLQLPSAPPGSIENWLLPAAAVASMALLFRKLFPGKRSDDEFV